MAGESPTRRVYRETRHPDIQPEVDQLSAAPRGLPSDGPVLPAKKGAFRRLARKASLRRCSLNQFLHDATIAIAEVFDAAAGLYNCFALE